MHNVCPICKQPVDSDDGFVVHLAVVHGLVDDAGTQTTLEQAMPMEHVESTADAETDAQADPEVPGTVADGEPAERAWDDDSLHPNRVYDPDADSERYRKVSLGLAGLLLIAAAAYLVGQQEPSPASTAGPSTSAALISDAAVTTSTAPPPVETTTTTPPLPVDSARALEATVVGCTEQGGVVTLRFSYVLQGAAQPDGRYEEMRIGQVANGPVDVGSVRVQDRLGRVVEVPLEPAPLSCG